MVDRIKDGGTVFGKVPSRECSPVKTFKLKQTGEQPDLKVVEKKRMSYNSLARRLNEKVKEDSYASPR